MLAYLSQVSSVVDRDPHKVDVEGSIPSPAIFISFSIALVLSAMDSQSRF